MNIGVGEGGGENAGDRKTKPALPRRGRRREQPSQAGVEWGIPGVDSCKPFRILDDGEGEGVLNCR